ncbi:MAG: tRNA uridine-5-carboxymethylaminomethyl(34) synthesis GTPase MnmE, partial [Hylemonella sp.]|nr:tRNA uridine-5-carboxymethylaminomethyl(34) synthesis GTPase MnmE [Hylemonella sp.]
DLTRANQAAYLEADKEIEKEIRSRVRPDTPLLDLWNKSDATGIRCQTGIALSAKTGEGLQALRNSLLEHAGWQPAGEGVYIARARHVQALQRVAMHLAQATAQMTERAPKLELLAEELRLGQNALGEITGEFSNEEMLGLIFSKFCIGK